jgi:CBS domain containing-hemolysin-like protein/mannitol/fructose-specific phosphotransferase system IIA component (Ntr-type)
VQSQCTASRHRSAEDTHTIRELAPWAGWTPSCHESAAAFERKARELAPVPQTGNPLTQKSLVPIAIIVLCLFLLLSVNAFFVLAEFAIVRTRPSRVDELVADNHPRAAGLQHIQAHLDEYLGVCQVGITLASVALGMVGNLATETILGHEKASVLSYALAMTLSYVVVSGSHIVLGEQVPKSVAIRIADRMALLCVVPLRVARAAFLPALWILTTLTNLVLSLFGMRQATNEELHTEGELRIILEHSQVHGLMSFRRLLFMENVFDFGELQVKDTMRSRSTVKCLLASAPWEENLKVVRASRFTRYPLLSDPNAERPTGLVHLKDLVLHPERSTAELQGIVRPLLTTQETSPLEALLVEMQRRRIHAAVVTNAEGRWTGFVTLEDILEEIVGTIRDEFEDEEPVRLADALSLERIFLDITAPSPMVALRRALGQIPKPNLPMPLEQLMEAISTRERLVGIYLGHGVAMPHARLSGLTRPFVMILRSLHGVPCDGTSELAHLLFVLLTPAGQPRTHLRLQSTIAALLHESEFVKDRLMNAESAEQILEAIRTGEQAALD